MSEESGPHEVSLDVGAAGEGTPLRVRFQVRSPQGEDPGLGLGPPHEGQPDPSGGPVDGNGRIAPDGEREAQHGVPEPLPPVRDLREVVVPALPQHGTVADGGVPPLRKPRPRAARIVRRPFAPEWWYARLFMSPDGRLSYEHFEFNVHAPKGGLGPHAEYTVVHDDLLPLGGVFLLFEIGPVVF